MVEVTRSSDSNSHSSTLSIRLVGVPHRYYALEPPLRNHPVLQSTATFHY